MQTYSTAAALGTTTTTKPNQSPRKEIIAIKKLNYSTNNVNVNMSNSTPRGQQHHPNMASYTTTTNSTQTTAVNKTGGSSSSKKQQSSSSQQQPQLSNFHQTSIDLEYLTRKLKQFQLTPSPSSPTLAVVSSSNSSRRSSSTKKQHQQHSLNTDTVDSKATSNSGSFKKHHYHLHRSISSAEHGMISSHNNPYLIEYAAKSEPNTDRMAVGSSATTMTTTTTTSGGSSASGTITKATSNKSATVLMRTAVMSENPADSAMAKMMLKEKMNRSQSQTYRRAPPEPPTQVTANSASSQPTRFEVSRVYASKLAFDKKQFVDQEFSCYSEASAVATAAAIVAAARSHRHSSSHSHHYSHRASQPAAAQQQQQQQQSKAFASCAPPPSKHHSSIKKSKSSHIIKSSYLNSDKLELGKSNEDYSDSNRTTPSSSQSQFLNHEDQHPKTQRTVVSSRSSKQSRGRSTTSTANTSSSEEEEHDEVDEAVDEEENEEEEAANENDEDEEEEDDDDESSSSSRIRSVSSPEENNNNNLAMKIKISQAKKQQQQQQLQNNLHSSRHHQHSASTAPFLFSKSGAAAVPTNTTAVTTIATLTNADSIKPISDLSLEAAAAARIKFRRASVSNLVNTYQSNIQQQIQQQQQSPKSIVIRREKSASIQNPAKNEDESLRQNLNSDTSASHNHRENFSTTTTSGIETSFKNSSSKGSGSGASQTKGSETQQQQQNQQQQDYVQKINELKNRLFVMEIELDNEKKKLAFEKEMKTKLMGELKLRYETEKTAALRALEAKLNADKLYELNKLKETFESDKRDEIDSTQKSFDSEMMSLKLKLRDKTEKCIQLEKLLKDEYQKNSKFYLKSMEVVRKYNQELKMLNENESTTTPTSILKNSSTNKPNNRLISIETQTIKIEGSTEKSTNTELSNTNETSDVTTIRSKLMTLKLILDEENSSSSAPIESIDLLIMNISTQVRELKLDVKTKSNELKQLKAQNTKIVTDYKQLKEAKLKLESLYKIKCKSDLNKSAQIKKLEIGYQIELIKFRNEFNSDLVRYLETKLLRKESLVNENFNLLTNVLKQINELTGGDAKEDNQQGDAEISLTSLKSKIEGLREPIKCLISSNLFTQCENNNSNNANGASADAGSIVSQECKKIPLNLIVKNSNSNTLEPSKIQNKFEDKLELVVANSGGTGQVEPKKIPIQKFSSSDDFTRTKKLHEDMAKLDRKLKNMEKLDLPKNKPVLLPGGCSFREELKKPNLSSALATSQMMAAATAAQSKPMSTSLSIAAINENLNPNNSSGVSTSRSASTARTNSIDTMLKPTSMTTHRKMNVQIIQQSSQHIHQQINIQNVPTETSRSDNHISTAKHSNNKQQIDANLLSCR